MSRAGRLAAVACTLGLSVLAACGGGGGGSTNPPTILPTSNPAPSGNPSGNPSPTPTGTTAPGPTPTPVQTATPGPTPTPVKTPTPAPTATPVKTPTPAPSSTPNTLLTVRVGNGEINGLDDQILTSENNPYKGGKGEGDLMPGDPDATAAGGGQGQTVDNIPSATSMSHNYHVHAFLGLIVNPTTFDAKNNEIAIPDGVGMVNPVGDFQGTDPNAPSYNTCTGGAVNWECYADHFYYMHTHDASGVIHMESPTPDCGAQVNWATLCTQSLFTLGNFFDIWGISVSNSVPAAVGNFGHYQGEIHVYTSPLGKYAGCTNTQCYTPSNQYTEYTGDPHSISLYSHTVIWIVIGAQPNRPASLPNIEWDIST